MDITNLAGKITVEYYAFSEFTLAMRDVLSNILLETGLIEEYENGQIIADWKDSTVTGDNKTEVYIAAYMDGGDGEEPACLFYRRDTVYNRNEKVSFTEYVHIPKDDINYKLCECRDWYMVGKNEKLEILTRYLDANMDLSYWKKIDIQKIIEEIYY
jgi:hypothetical protein